MPLLTALPTSITDRQLALAKAALFALSLLPLAHLGWDFFNDSLGANPVETITHRTGDWTFNFLLLTLTVTPLRSITSMHWLTRTRRMLGLFAFFYGTLHLLTFTGFDHAFDLGEMAKDILKRPFVTVGFAAWALMLPLALTSSNRAIRLLGGKRWQSLHRSVYAVGILALLHYFWLVKVTALVWPILYAIALGLLLGWRARDRMRRAGPWPTGPKVQTINFMKKQP